MADRRRDYSVVVVYDRDGRPHSHCTAESTTVALDIERVYRRSYTEQMGFKLVTYPVTDHAAALAFRPPPLQNRPSRWQKPRTEASDAPGHLTAPRLKNRPKTTPLPTARAARAQAADVAGSQG